MIIHSILSKIKNKVLPISLQGNYRDRLEKLSSTSYGLFGAERVSILWRFLFSLKKCACAFP